MRSKKFRLGLIGFPLGHSLSPRLHQVALQASGLDGEYKLYPIPPGEDRRTRLQSLLDLLRSGELQGLNVTIPLKLEVMAFLDGMTHAAQAIGAVNTLYEEDSQLVGDNTDAAGFLADLERQYGPGAGHPSTALVLGAGGAARAVTYALTRSGWRVIVAARRIGQARDLVNVINGSSNRQIVSSRAIRRDQLSAILLESDSIREHLDRFSMMINTTPIGMSPHNSTSPWPTDLPFPQGVFVYDLVYNPAETMLVQQARRADLQAANGLGMLVEQAALAFERWTKVAAPRQMMRQALQEDGG